MTRESYGESYDFLFGIKNIDGEEIQFAWKELIDPEKSQEYFNNLINAALNYLFPSIVEKINNRLKAGHSVQIRALQCFGRGCARFKRKRVGFF